MSAYWEMRWTGYQSAVSAKTPKSKRTTNQTIRVLVARWLWPAPVPAASGRFARLLMLYLPIVLDLGVVVGDAALILGVVETIRQVDQHGGIGSNHFITMCDARWNQQLPSPQRSDIQRVAGAEGG